MGSMRLQYPPEVRILLVLCTGRVDLLHLLKAFELGFDAVFVSGCHEGDCHYLAGNIRAKKRVNKLKKDLEAMASSPSAWRCSTSAPGKDPSLPRCAGKWPSGSSGWAPAR